MDEFSVDSNYLNLVQNISADNEQLLRSCTKLMESLPVSEPQFCSYIKEQKSHDAFNLSNQDASYMDYLNTTVANVEWPTILGDFRSLSSKLTELGRKAESAKLNHMVAVPTDPVPQPNGMPSMLIPELLRTKRSPEQELKNERVRKLVRPTIEKIPCDSKGNPNEKEAGIGVITVRSMILRYNSTIDEVLKELMESKIRSDLKHNCDATTTAFSVSRTKKSPHSARDLMKYLHTGQFGD